MVCATGAGQKIYGPPLKPNRAFLIFVSPPARWRRVPDGPGLRRAPVVSGAACIHFALWRIWPCGLMTSSDIAGPVQGRRAVYIDCAGCGKQGCVPYPSLAGVFTPANPRSQGNERQPPRDGYAGSDQQHRRTKHRCPGNRIAGYLDDVGRPQPAGKCSTQLVHQRA